MVYADARAQRLLGLAAGIDLVSRAAPGSEAKLAEALQRGATRPVDGWEVAFAVRERLVQVSLTAQPHPDGVVLLVLVLPSAVHAALDRVSAMVSEVVDLNRLIVKHRNELARRADAGSGDSSEWEWLGHELAGAAELLREAVETPSGRRAVAIVRDAARRLAPPVALVPVPIGDLVATIRRSVVRIVPRAAQIELISVDPPGVVTTDPDVLALLACCLVGDAIERDPDARVKLCLAAAGRGLRLTVEGALAAGPSQRVHDIARGLAGTLGGRLTLEPGVYTVELPA